MDGRVFRHMDMGDRYLSPRPVPKEKGMYIYGSEEGRREKGMNIYGRGREEGNGRRGRKEGRKGGRGGGREGGRAEGVDAHTFSTQLNYLPYHPTSRSEVSYQLQVTSSHAGR